MFFDYDIKADRLPPRTVCLTYDDGPGETAGDGPGPRTRELGRFLQGQGVRATFFVVGKHVEQHPGAVAALRDGGHLVGNHTYSHPGLVKVAESGGDVVGELARTGALLRRDVHDDLIYFRAPYGNWRQRVSEATREDRPESIVAAVLNASGRFADHVGPVNWDIVAGDWNCWRHDVPPEDCARGYLDKIEEIGRGMVLMHDSSEEDDVRPKNQTLRMSQVLVPELKRRGYRFVRLDEIPQVRSAAMVRAQVVIKTPGGAPLRLDREGSDEVRVGPRSAGVHEPFGVVPLGDGRIALRARNGLFLSVPGEPAGVVRAVGPGAGPGETFVTEPQGGHGFVLRSLSGAPLTLDDDREGGRLWASTRAADRLPFDFEPVHEARPGTTP